MDERKAATVHHLKSEASRAKSDLMRLARSLEGAGA